MQMSWENYDDERDREQVLEFHDDEIATLKKKVSAWEANAEEALRELEELIVNLPESVLQMVPEDCKVSVFDWIEEAGGHLIAVDVERKPVRPAEKYPIRAQAWDEAMRRLERARDAS
jgi:hypothetical protein